MPDACGVIEVEEDPRFVNFMTLPCEPARERRDMGVHLGIDRGRAELGDIEDPQAFVRPRRRGCGQ